MAQNTGNENTNATPGSRRGTSGRNEANRPNDGNNKKKTKETFTGAIESLPVLMFPDERKKGSAVQYKRFYDSLKGHVAREVGKGAAKLWALNYLKQDNPMWKPPVPTKPKDDADDELKLLYESEKESYIKSIGAAWRAAKVAIWAIIMDQCSPKLANHLRQLAFFDGAESDADCITLLQQVSVVCSGGRILGFEPQARAKALLDFIHFKQRGLTNEEYLNEFKARYATFKTLGGDLQNKSDTWTNGFGAQATTNQALLVCLFLGNSNKKDYGDLVRDLQNDAAAQVVKYPQDLNRAYTLL